MLRFAAEFIRLTGNPPELYSGPAAVDPALANTRLHQIPKGAGRFWEPSRRGEWPVFATATAAYVEQVFDLLLLLSDSMAHRIPVLQVSVEDDPHTLPIMMRLRCEATAWLHGQLVHDA